MHARPRGQTVNHHMAARLLFVAFAASKHVLAYQTVQQQPSSSAMSVQPSVSPAENAGAANVRDGWKDTSTGLLVVVPSCSSSNSPVSNRNPAT